MDAKRRVQRIASHILPTASSILSNTTTTTTLTSTSFTAIIATADDYEATNQNPLIFPLLKPYLDNNNSSNSNGNTTSLTPLEQCEILWRLSRAHERMWHASVATGNTTARDEHLRLGLSTSQTAVQKNTASGDANKWRAIFLGMEAEAGGVITSARNANLIHTHLQAALIELPNDASMHFMMGRTIFTMAGATWSERTAAKVIGYTIPAATFSDSISHFRKAQKLAPTSIMNVLWLSKSYLRSEKNKTKSLILGKKWLLRASKMKVLKDEDIMAQKEAKELVRGLR